jgi:hypothetical protein
MAPIVKGEIGATGGGGLSRAALLHRVVLHRPSIVCEGRRQHHDGRGDQKAARELRKYSKQFCFHSCKNVSNFQKVERASLSTFTQAGKL